MSDTTSSPAEATEPRGLRAGHGRYVFELAGANHVQGGPAYSTAAGSLIECERSLIGLMRMPRGTGARPHSHPNEQWVYMLEGILEIEVDGVRAVAGPGCLVYFPPNSVHSTKVGSDEDAVFLTGKDRSHGLWGNPVEADSPNPVSKA